MARALLGLLLLLCACQRPAPGAAAPPGRVVTLTPSLTEIAFALGAGDRVVGVSDYCDYPAEAARRPRVGSFLQPSLEKILALRPDLILVDGVQGDVAAALRQAGLRVLAVPMQSLGDVRAAISAVGGPEGLGRPEAASRLLAGFDRELRETSERVAGRRRPRALFIVDREVGGLRGLVAAGPGSYLDELLTRAGGDNVFADLPMRYAKVAVEEVTARRPEVILDAVHVEGAEAERQASRDWQALGDVPATRRGQVHLLLTRAFVTPGPRLGAALRELSRLLHPETLAESR